MLNRRTALRSLLGFLGLGLTGSVAKAVAGPQPKYHVGQILYSRFDFNWEDNTTFEVKSIIYGPHYDYLDKTTVESWHYVCLRLNNEKNSLNNVLDLVQEKALLTPTELQAKKERIRKKRGDLKDGDKVKIVGTTTGRYEMIGKVGEVGRVTEDDIQVIFSRSEKGVDVCYVNERSSLELLKA